MSFQTNSVLVFQKDEHFFGFPTTSVREVVSLGEVQALPLTPSFLLGVARYREFVIPVIDLTSYFRLSENRDSSVHRSVVVEFKGALCAVAADRFLNTITPSHSKYLDTERSDSNFFPNISVKRYEYESEELSILDFDSLISSDAHTNSEERNPDAAFPKQSISESYLLKFFAGGFSFAADVSSISYIGDGAWPQSVQKEESLPASALSLSGILGIEPGIADRTLVVKTNDELLGLGVEAISNSSIKRYKIVPVPQLLHQWISPMVFAGFTWSEMDPRIVAVLDLKVMPLLMKTAARSCA